MSLLGAHGYSRGSGIFLSVPHLTLCSLAVVSASLPHISSFQAGILSTFLKVKP